MTNEEFATSLEQNYVIKFLMLLRFNDHTVLWPNVEHNRWLLVDMGHMWLNLLAKDCFLDGKYFTRRIVTKLRVCKVWHLYPTVPDEGLVVGENPVWEMLQLIFAFGVNVITHLIINLRYIYFGAHYFGELLHNAFVNLRTSFVVAKHFGESLTESTRWLLYPSQLLKSLNHLHVNLINRLVKLSLIRNRDSDHFLVNLP